MSDQAPERIWILRDIAEELAVQPRYGGFAQYARLDTVYTREQVETMVAEERERWYEAVWLYCDGLTAEDVCACAAIRAQ